MTLILIILTRVKGQWTRTSSLGACRWKRFRTWEWRSPTTYCAAMILDILQLLTCSILVRVICPGWIWHLIDTLTGQANGRLQILTNEVVSPTNTYYTSLSVTDTGVIDMTNQTELITVECLTINGTIRVNMSSIDTPTQLNNIDLFKFTCTSTNISAIAMDIITSNECQSSYVIREKIVGRTRTVNADVSISCPNSPGSTSNQPGQASGPRSNNSPGSPSTSPSTSPQSALSSSATILQSIVAFTLITLLA